MCHRRTRLDATEFRRPTGSGRVPPVVVPRRPDRRSSHRTSPGQAGSGRSPPRHDARKAPPLSRSSEPARRSLRCAQKWRRRPHHSGCVCSVGVPVAEVLCTPAAIASSGVSMIRNASPRLNIPTTLPYRVAYLLYIGNEPNDCEDSRRLSQFFLDAFAPTGKPEPCAPRRPANAHRAGICVLLRDAEYLGGRGDRTRRTVAPCAADRPQHSQRSAAPHLQFLRRQHDNRQRAARTQWLQTHCPVAAASSNRSSNSPAESVLGLALNHSVDSGG